MHGAPFLLSAPRHTTSTQEHKAMTVMCTAPGAILAPFVISTHPFKAGLPDQSGVLHCHHILGCAYGTGLQGLMHVLVHQQKMNNRYHTANTNTSVIN